jgi:hypothetical protein
MEHRGLLRQLKTPAGTAAPVRQDVLLPCQTALEICLIRSVNASIFAITANESGGLSRDTLPIHRDLGHAESSATRLFMIERPRCCDAKVKPIPSAPPRESGK